MEWALRSKGSGDWMGDRTGPCLRRTLEPLEGVTKYRHLGPVPSESRGWDQGVSLFLNIRIENGYFTWCIILKISLLFSLKQNQTKPTNHHHHQQNPTA